ncbi:hypothetical protein [Streptomyces sp. NPDC102409]|uniref:hypothetical protein n=1 Tax=Streptomyces sp. NPDC102409 TaxID=3366172 RepID=UPI00381F9FE3
MLPVLLIVGVVVLLAGVHWQMWRRLVRDVTTASGPARRAGAVAAFALPLLSIGALIAGQVGAPFWLQQSVAWPGFVWLALLLYVVLALVAGEVLRPLLSRALDRRATSRTRPASTKRCGCCRPADWSP